MSKNSEIASLLIAHGAKATSDAFSVAAFSNDVERMKVLHAAGTNIDSVDREGVPAIVTAARLGNIDALEWLISHGAQVNQTDALGISALSWAKLSGNLLAEEIIIRAGGVEAAAVFSPDEDESDKASYGSAVRQQQKRIVASYRPAALIHKTLSGHLVRSKSEVIVADALYNRGILFSYENPFFGKDGRTFKLPDFTINLSAGSVVIWEHLGMLDQESYRHAWNKKLLWYLQNGLERSDLYVTNESIRNGIDSLEIASVADAILGRLRE